MIGGAIGVSATATVLHDAALLHDEQPFRPQRSVNGKRRLAFEEPASSGSNHDLKLRCATADSKDDAVQPVVDITPVTISYENGDGLLFMSETQQVPKPSPLHHPTSPPGNFAPRFMIEPAADTSESSLGIPGVPPAGPTQLTVPNGPAPMRIPGIPSLNPSEWGEMTMSRRLSGQSGLAELAELAKQEAAAKDKQLEKYIERKKNLMLGARHIHLELPEGSWKERAHMLLSWVWFDFCVGLVILCNSVTIGVESIHKTKAEAGEAAVMPLYIGIFDNIFLAVYALELSLRIFAYGLKAFQNSWVRFDALLVGSGVFEILLSAFLSGAGQLEQLMLVRMLRLTRLARMVRFFSQFRVLWALVSGLMHSVNTLVWTFVLIISLLYIFAVLSIDLMPKEEGASDAYNEAAANFNSGLGLAMLTLLQFLSFDSIGVIYMPIVVEKPHLVFFFIIVILLVSICLMNLVIAVMVEMNIEASRADRDIQKLLDDGRKKKMMPKLKELFQDLDGDGSGDVELEEIINAPEEAKQYLQDVAKGLDLEELYKMLDYDGSGTINADEFCEGLIKASTSDKPLELLRLVSASSDILVQLRDAKRLLEETSIESMHKRLEKVEDQVSTLTGRLDKMETQVVRIANWFRNGCHSMTVSGAV
mmetsp:Transcript_57805/g.137636  ORF Transcript_57805/g.137636 Transcript_57805/m.137636 type:complete len:648 (-) Transcript_57805:108-2051(-)|eukprot:CAMPEP_0178386986 /NCGR_PEP_ID=MMETSP0689_2-20121128/8844_1 /TAXON_ID=160604 /ORGANISM="Amphidinium massartii, Strain CS-259" /LENGTH=647 /DNA_ID=CAMNT_0020007343 /DNA_START=22 /DNA_END=1965 /DNA_ORIENTATION=+